MAAYFWIKIFAILLACSSEMSKMEEEKTKNGKCRRLGEPETNKIVHNLFGLDDRKIHGDNADSNRIEIRYFVQSLFSHSSFYSPSALVFFLCKFIILSKSWPKWCWHWRCSLKRRAFIHVISARHFVSFVFDRIASHVLLLLEPSELTFAIMALPLHKSCWEIHAKWNCDSNNRTHAASTHLTVRMNK